MWLFAEAPLSSLFIRPLGSHSHYVLPTVADGFSCLGFRPMFLTTFSTGGPRRFKRQPQGTHTPQVHLRDGNPAQHS